MATANDFFMIWGMNCFPVLSARDVNFSHFPMTPQNSGAQIYRQAIPEKVAIESASKITMKRSVHSRSNTTRKTKESEQIYRESKPKNNGR